MAQEKMKFRTSVEPPDGGWGYACLLGMVVCQMLFGLSVRVFALLYIILLDEFHTTATIASSVGAVHILTWGCFGPFASIVCTTYGCRFAAAIGTILQSVGFILTGCAPNVGTVFFTFGLLVGIGTSLCTTASYLIVSEYFNKRRALATSIGSSGSSISVVVLPACIKYIMNRYDFSGTMLILGGICLHGLVGAALYRPLPKLPHPQLAKEKTDRTLLKQGDQAKALCEEDVIPNLSSNKRSSTQSACSNENEKRLCNWNQPKCVNSIPTRKNNKMLCCSLQCKCLSTIKSYPIVMCLMLVNFSAALNHSVVSGFTPSLAIENGVSELLAFLLITWSGIFDVIGRCFVGFIMDLKNIKSHVMVVYGAVALISALCCTLFPLYNKYAYYVAVIALSSIFTGVVFAQRSTVLLSVLSSKEMPVIFGVLQCCNSIGMMTGRALTGVLRDLTGGYNYAYFTTGFVAFLSALFLLLAMTRNKKRAESTGIQMTVAGIK